MSEPSNTDPTTFEDEAFKVMFQCVDFHSALMVKLSSGTPERRQLMEALETAASHIARAHSQALAEAVEAVIGQDEPNYYGGIDYTNRKEYRNELRREQRARLTQLQATNTTKETR